VSHRDQLIFPNLWADINNGNLSLRVETYQQLVDGLGQGQSRNAHRTVSSRGAGGLPLWRIQGAAPDLRNSSDPSSKSTARARRKHQAYTYSTWELLIVSALHNFPLPVRYGALSVCILHTLRTADACTNVRIA